MNKYNFDLDMESDNSNSTILRNIELNSRVLEFGCAHGRMTKYLKEVLNCEIDIIEKDYEAIGNASQWANKAWQIDLNKDCFYANGKYDYIIFADILEHLLDPRSVLLDSLEYLKNGGSIWISIPNIGHNSVLIDLWNNKFSYRSTGILDETHLKFFTEDSLTKMIESCNLKINQKFNLINVVENTEFKNSYNDVPDTIVELMKARDNAEVYQFVWELKC